MSDYVAVVFNLSQNLDPDIKKVIADLSNKFGRETLEDYLSIRKLILEDSYDSDDEPQNSKMVWNYEAVDGHLDEVHSADKQNWEAYTRPILDKPTSTAQTTQSKSIYDVDQFITDFSEIHKAEPVESLFTLDDQLFMPRGKVCMLASEGGYGKSLLAMSLGLSIVLDEDTALRSPSGKHSNIKANIKSGKVALLYAEEDKNTSLYRLRSLLNKHPDHSDTKVIDGAMIGKLNRKLRILPLQTTDRSLDTDLSLSDPIGVDTGAIERFDTLYKSLSYTGGQDGFDLIVIDPLAQFGNGNFEVDNGEASKLMRQFQQLTSLPGNPTVLLVHHSSKASKKGKLSHTVRGASALRDNARWVGNLRRLEENDTGDDYLKHENGDTVVELIVVKSNYGQCFQRGWFLIGETIKAIKEADKSNREDEHQEVRKIFHNPDKEDDEEDSDTGTDPKTNWG